MYEDVGLIGVSKKRAISAKEQYASSGVNAKAAFKNPKINNYLKDTISNNNNLNAPSNKPQSFKTIPKKHTPQPQSSKTPKSKQPQRQSFTSKPKQRIYTQ